MSTVMCPHCHSDVPHGAKVCRGCQAEVEYGAPSAALVFVLLVSSFAGWKVGAMGGSILGWLTFAVLVAAGLYGCARFFKHRVNFKRIYRTK